jgi:hypothetical protein
MAAWEFMKYHVQVVCIVRKFIWCSVKVGRVVLKLKRRHPFWQTNREQGDLIRALFLILEAAFIFVRFEVFRAVTMKKAVFLGVAPYRSCVNRRFGWTYRLHLQGIKIRERETSVSRWLQSPWKCRRYVPPKRRITQDLHGITSQEIAFFGDSICCNSNLQGKDCLRWLVVSMCTWMNWHKMRPRDRRLAMWLWTFGPKKVRNILNKWAALWVSGKSISPGFR